jgi:hypothetical protein
VSPPNNHRPPRGPKSSDRSIAGRASDLSIANESKVYVFPTTVSLVAILGPNDEHLNTVARAFPNTTVTVTDSDPPSLDGVIISGVGCP